MYERSEILCYMLGWIECDKSPIKRSDALIILDQILTQMNQPVVSEPEKDILRQLRDEISIFLMQAGVSREQTREIGRTVNYESS